MKKVIVYLAEGFEEVEAMVPVDMLKRAEVEVTTVSITDEKAVRGAHGNVFVADKTVSEVEAEEYDGVFLPGGMPGALNLSQSMAVNLRIIKMASEGKLVSAICASPSVVLANAGLLENRKATVFPGCEGYSKKTDWSQDSVVVDGNIITGKAAGAAFEMAFAMIAWLSNEKTAEKVRTGVYYHCI